MNEREFTYRLLASALGGLLFGHGWVVSIWPVLYPRKYAIIVTAIGAVLLWFANRQRG